VNNHNSFNVEARDNTVTLSGGTVNGSVYGGLASGVSGEGYNGYATANGFAIDVPPYAATPAYVNSA
jgi:hypothetical protein